MFRDIINTYRQAFRVYVRQRTRPFSIEEAEEKRLFWSKAYAFSAIMCLLTATYYTKRENLNFNYRTDISKEEAVLETRVDKPTKVIKFRNFQKIGEYEYIPPSYRKNDTSNESGIKQIPKSSD